MKTVKIVIGLIVLLLIVWGISLLVGNKGAVNETGPIKIGWIGPLTGDGATLGQNAKDATMMAVEEINAGGGINGRQIEMIYEDGKCSGKDAANAASKLINVDKVAAIFGGACSAETLAFTNLAEQSKMPTLSWCSSAPSITTAGDYIFRVVPSDAYQGAFAADYIFNSLGKKKVAILYQQTEWASGIVGVFSGEFEKLGGQIVSNEGFDGKIRDFKTPLAKIKTVDPDLIYFVSYAEPAIPALKQIADMGIKTPLFGADAWSDPKILAEAKGNAEGIMFTGLAAHTNQAFSDKLQARTNGATVSECSAPAYDGMNVLAAALKVGGTNAEQLKNALYQVDYKSGTAYDEIKLDQNGDLIGAQYAVRKIVDGEAVEVK